MRVSGFVLTGGTSTRMGRDKALLPLDGGALVQSIATVVEGVAGNVTLVGQPQRYGHLPWPALPDLRPASGPLGGLETALTNSGTELNLVVACDMPGLRADWLQALLRAAGASSALCMATRGQDGQAHPLCALYRKQCLPFITRALDARRFQLMALLEEIGAVYLQAEAELANVNTPLDWSRWQADRLQPGR